MNNYEKLCKKSREIALLNGIDRILDWDQEVMMPSGAAAIRSDQVATLAAITHEKSTGTSFKNLLAKLIDLPSGKVATGVNPQQSAALREWRHDYLRAKALPKSFVVKYAKLTSEAREVWRQARAENNFQLLEPYLKKIVALNKKKAEHIGYAEHPYDALVDGFEPGMTTKEITRLFTEIREPVTALVKQIGEHQQVDDTLLYGQFPKERQMAVMNKLLNRMGFQEKYNRLDLSSHPFSSSSHPTDSRITTRVYPDSFHHNLLACLHEWGHALYELGLPKEEFGTPLGEAIGLAMHESQSRWWETRIGQSRGFCEYFLPFLQNDLGIKHATVDQLYHALNKVSPTFIRVEADEVTYPLHVILRFEIEVALIEEKIQVKEIPEIWNNKMEQLLGIRPKTDSEGCLQDIHWPMGAFGYFPTYALGNIYAGQLFETFEKEYPNWEEQVAKGEFEYISNWLRQKIHSRGRELRSPNLLHTISGKKLTSEPYLNYLTQKYNKIYPIPSSRQLIKR